MEKKTVSSAWEMCNICAVGFPLSSYYVAIFRWPIVAAQKLWVFFVLMKEKKKQQNLRLTHKKLPSGLVNLPI